MQRAKVNKYIGSIGERLEESLSNGFVAAEFGGLTLQHCFSCGELNHAQHMSRDFLVSSVILFEFGSYIKIPYELTKRTSKRFGK